MSLHGDANMQSNLASEMQQIRVERELWEEEKKRWLDDLHRMQITLKGLQETNRDLLLQNQWLNEKVAALKSQNTMLQRVRDNHMNGIGNESN